MSLHSARRVDFGFHSQRTVVVEPSAALLTAAQLSGEAGLLVVREFDEYVGLTARFAAAIEDSRDPVFTQQSLLAMVRQRVYGVLADYEDQNDHEQLRSDPIFKLSRTGCRTIPIWPVSRCCRASSRCGRVVQRGLDCGPEATA